MTKRSRRITVALPRKQRNIVVLDLARVKMKELAHPGERNEQPALTEGSTRPARRDVSKLLNLHAAAITRLCNKVEESKNLYKKWKSVLPWAGPEQD